jgi:hypothetical protein
MKLRRNNIIKQKKTTQSLTKARYQKSENKEYKDDDECLSSIDAALIYCPLGHKYCGLCVEKQIRKLIIINPETKIENIKCKNLTCNYNFDFDRIKKLANYSVIYDLLKHNYMKSNTSSSKHDLITNITFQEKLYI